MTAKYLEEMKLLCDECTALFHLLPFPLFPLIYAFIGCMLYVPWLEIEPITLAYWYDALTNGATQLGQHFFFKIQSSGGNDVDTENLMGPYWYNQRKE